MAKLITDQSELRQWQAKFSAANVEEKRARRPALVDVAVSLGLSGEGTVDTLLKRMRTFFLESQNKLTSSCCANGYMSAS